MSSKDHKRKVLILSCCMAVKNVAGPVTREEVQRLRGMSKLNYKSAMQFLRGATEADDLFTLIESAKSFAKKLRTYDEAAFKKRLPHLNDMYAIIPKGADFKSKVHAPEDAVAAQIPIKVHLVTLNALLRQRNLKPLATWRGTHAAILERIAKVRKAMEQDRSDVQRVPTVVANGAYKSDEEAFAKTGHRTSGRNKGDDKHDARKARFIASRIEPLPEPKTYNLKGSDIKKGKFSAAIKTAKSKRGTPITSKGPTVHLREIAAALNIEAKVARHKARRYATELQKLEVGKYTYPKEKIDAVKAILNADNRKRQ